MHIAYLGTEERRDYLQGFAGRDTLVHTLAGFQPSIRSLSVSNPNGMSTSLSRPSLSPWKRHHRRNYEAV